VDQPDEVDQAVPVDPVVRVVAVVPAARVDLAPQRVPVAAVVRVDPVALAARAHQAARVVRAVPVAPAAVAAVAGAGSTAPVGAAMRPVLSASLEAGLRVGASPSAPSAKNSTTWRRRPSVAFGCHAAAARASGCRAVRP